MNNNEIFEALDSIADREFSVFRSYANHGIYQKAQQDPSSAIFKIADEMFAFHWTFFGLMHGDPQFSEAREYAEKYIDRMNHLLDLAESELTMRNWGTT